MLQVAVLNGPNLSRLGIREPEIYGNTTSTELQHLLSQIGESLGLQVRVQFTHDEAELIEWIHNCVDAETPVILNPAAFTHYSYGLRDACAQLGTAGIPLIEVHLSNPATRKSFRHNSVISAVASGTVAGFGVQSYTLALQAVADMIKSATENI